MKNESEFLREIVKKATNLSDAKFDITNKGGENDLVTNLDLQIERFLIDEIKKEYPNFDIVSEEFNTNNEITENCFIIDPIDGTILQIICHFGEFKLLVLKMAKQLLVL